MLAECYDWNSKKKTPTGEEYLDQGYDVWMEG